MKITFEKDLYRSYMVAEEAEDPAHGFEEKMLDACGCRGLLPFSVRVIDGQKQYLYDITGLTALSELLAERALGQRQFALILETLAQISSSMEAYLLDMDGLYIEPSAIFMDEEGTRAAFAYIPGYDQPLKVQLAQFSTFLLEHADHEEREGVLRVYDFYKKVRQKEFSAAVFSELLQENRREQRFCSPGQDREVSGTSASDAAGSPGKSQGKDRGRYSIGDSEDPMGDAGPTAAGNDRMGLPEEAVKGKTGSEKQRKRFKNHRSGIKPPVSVKNTADGRDKGGRWLTVILITILPAVAAVIAWYLGYTDLLLYSLGMQPMTLLQSVGVLILLIAVCALLGLRIRRWLLSRPADKASDAGKKQVGSSSGRRRGALKRTDREPSPGEDIFDIWEGGAAGAGAETGTGERRPESGGDDLSGVFSRKAAASAGISSGSTDTAFDVRTGASGQGIYSLTYEYDRPKDASGYRQTAAGEETQLLTGEEETGLLSEQIRNVRLISLRPALCPDLVMTHFPCRIGRTGGATEGTLNVPGVSREHAILEDVDGRIVIKDCGSRNGTFVNGVRLRDGQAQRLSPGDRIAFADVYFRLEM